MNQSYGHNPGKGIFFGNMKGGVGKSTLCACTFAMLKKIEPSLDLLLIDTDIQGSTTYMMSNVVKRESLRYVPISNIHDSTALSMLDGIVRAHLARPNSMVLLDSASGAMGSLWQIVMQCDAMIVPTSLSWTDIGPTIDYIKEIDARKADFASMTPHIIVVPNRNSPRQRNYDELHQAAAELNVVLAPPVCNYSLVRTTSHNFKGLESIDGSRFGKEVEGLAQFINTHVRSGKLDRIYSAG